MKNSKLYASLYMGLMALLILYVAVTDQTATYLGDERLDATSDRTQMVTFYLAVLFALIHTWLYFEWRYDQKKSKEDL